HRGGGDARKLLPESLSSAAVLALLIGAFLSLHWIAAGGAGAPLDPLTEAALGALALIAAGHVLMPRPGQALGLISAWRAHVLMGAGLLYALLGPGLGANPWWGERPAAVIGPPLLDSLALAFALPA